MKRLALVGAIVAAAIAMLLSLPRDTPPAEASAAVASSPTDPDRLSAPSVLVRDPSPDPKVVVRDAATRQVVPNVRFLPVAGPEATVRDDARAVASPSGAQRLVELERADAWLVRAAGYLPAWFDRDSGAEEVLLQPGRSLELQLRHEDGNPVVGAHAWLYPSGARRHFEVGAWQGSGVGDPRSPVPTWTEVSDGNGSLRFDSLPEGSYRLRIEHHEAFVATAVGRGDADVAVPGNLQIDFLDLHAVVFRAPVGRTIREHSWLLPAGLDHDPAIQRFRGAALTRLGTRFPDALVFVGRPRSGAGADDATMRVQAMLDGNTAAMGEWPLAPIRQVLDAAWLELRDDIVYRALVCRVVDRAGTPLRLRMRVQEHREDGARVLPRFAMSDEPVLLQPGAYGIYPEAVPPWILDSFQGQDLVIRSTDPETVEKVVRIDRAVRLVHIAPAVPEGASPKRAAHFAIRAASQNYAVMNWTADSEPIEILLPIGPVEVSVQSAHFRMDPMTLDVSEGLGPMQVSLQLVSLR